MQSAYQIALERLTNFFNVRSNYDRLIDLQTGHPMPLRLVEWYVVHYSRQRQKQVHAMYKNKLKGMTKENFDPYRRRSKSCQVINFVCDHGSVQTTFAQVNFFRWVIENKIIEFIENDYTTVYSEFKRSGGRSLET